MSAWMPLPRRAAPSGWRRIFLGALALLALGWAPSALALPLFARQTGQNCMACHAGGQFPELTPYGRLFKMTGYTIGQRTVPLSVMGVLSNSSVANTSKSDDPASDFHENERTILAAASIFTGGKITDNAGAFVQATYDPYSIQHDDGSFQGRTVMDNVDLRYADRRIDPASDLIWGVSANNNPSVSDPWNTAPAWMQYVPVPSPGSSQFVDGNAPYPCFASDAPLGGVTAYAFWNRTVYAELGGYGTARGIFSPMRAGLHDDEVPKLSGVNPYWRLAWNHEWGAHSLMVGTGGMDARFYDDPLDTSDPSTLHHTRDLLFDTQYQYLLDPHAFTAQLVYEHSTNKMPEGLANQSVSFVDVFGNALPVTSAEDKTDLLRAKLTYVYRAKYGGSIGIFDLTGTTDTANQTSGYSPDTLTVTSDSNAQAASERVSGNFTGNPATRGTTLEAFWTPLQYLRLGVQYTAYSKYNGASVNYDGFGRNASDNNTLFFYVWAAY